MNRPYLVLLSVITLGSGCAAGGTNDAGGGGPVDAGGGGGSDAGDMGFDAGDMGFDAGGPIGFDAGPAETDAGTTGSDAGVGLIDAGPGSGTDASVGLIDAGFDASLPDAGPAPTGSIALTPGFMTTVTGDTTGGPTWNRPVASGSCPASTLSAVADAVTYETRLIHNASSGTITVTIGSTATYDGYLVIYLGTSVPADALMCHAGDDDGGPTGSDPLVTFTLAAGQSAVVVQSGFDNADVGPYSMTISAT